MTVDYELDYDVIKQKVDDYKAEHGEIASRPPGFVPDSIAIKLTNRCRPLVAFLAEYTKLCDRSNKILDVSADQTKWIEGFTTDIALLEHVEEGHAHKYEGNNFRLRWIVQTIMERKDHEIVDDYITRLFVLLKGVKFGDYITNVNDTEIGDNEYDLLYGKLREVIDNER